MRAAVFEGAGVVRLQDVPEPTLTAPDDVLIDVEACGICGTDLQILNVPPGHPADAGVVMGHEFIGHVTALGADAAATGLKVGQRVAVDPDATCGTCRFCRAGRPANCENIRALGIFRNGALAARSKSPVRAVYPIADGPATEIAALIEPLACVVNGVNRANPRPGESALIYGAGPIGCLFAAVFKAAGVSPIVVIEPTEARRGVIRAVGADEALGPDAFEARRDELFPTGADIVVDAVGTRFAAAVDDASLGGRIVLFGQNANARPEVKQYTITARSLTVVGTYITSFTFPQAIRMVEQGILNLAPMVTHVLPLERLSEGLDLLRSGAATKVVIRPTGM
jgi:threonine dehydrogenase-like Zn-dependent dehydrogenase